MTQKEIKDKIADWENRLKNPSVAGVPSAVTKINSEIAKLEAMLEKEEKPKAEKKEKVAKEPKKEKSEHEKHEAKETKAGPSPKYKVGDILWHDTKYKGEYKKVKILAVTGWTGDGHRYDVEFVDDNNKGINKFARSYDEDLSKTEPKKDAYDCDDLVKEAKERHAKAKAAAEARANAPKKSEATKDKEKIEKVHETVEKQLEKGKLNKSQLEKLIAETKDLLKLLEKALKNL